MSRLASFSPAALRAMFSPDADDTLVTLITITGPGISTPVRLADNYKQRISEDSDEVIYGLVSRSQTYTFIPFSLTLPSEEQGQASRAQLTIYDVTRQLVPVVRQLSAPPSVLIELVLYSTPNTLEASFVGFYLSGIEYTAEMLRGDLNVESYRNEPFPSHTFNPTYAPGIF